MRHGEKLLLQLTVFLIPTNLAYHWLVPQAYSYGHLLDYLIPRLYLSDLPLLMLLAVWLKRGRLHLPSPLLISSVVLWFYLLLTSLILPVPMPGLWFFAKLVELSLFTAYLLSFPKPLLLKTILPPLLLALCFQTIIAGAQYIRQKEVIGYYLLGEPALSRSVGLAADTTGGTWRILPYGTTPHPNVLAGFAVVVCLIVAGWAVYNPNLRMSKWLSIITICLSLLLITLTRSVTAMLALLWLGTCLVYSQRTLSSTRVMMLSLIYSAGILTFMVLFALSGYHYLRWFDNGSLSNRYKLYSHAVTLIAAHPPYRRRFEPLYPVVN